jgi:hypothetical protein
MVRLKAGRLYFTRAVYDRYFAGLASVILIRREADLMIMPVRHAAAGGYVIKVRNAAGDRLVEAMDFFRAQGLGDAETADFLVAWSSEAGALVVRNAFDLQT